MPDDFHSEAAAVLTQPAFSSTPAGAVIALSTTTTTTTPNTPGAPSPQPVTPGSRGGGGDNTRVRLNKREKLAVVRLCLHHGDEFTNGSRASFWSKISELGTREIGRPVKNPSQILRKMLEDFVARSSPYCGDVEYERVMALWKQRVDQTGDGRRHNKGRGTRKRDFAQLEQLPLLPAPPPPPPPPPPAGDETEEWDSSADEDDGETPSHHHHHHHHHHQHQQQLHQEERNNKRRRLLEDAAERFEKELAREKTKSLTKLLEKFVDENSNIDEAAATTTSRDGVVDNAETSSSLLERRLEKLEARQERMEARQEETMKTMAQLMQEVRDNTNAILALLRTKFAAAGSEQGQGQGQGHEEASN